MTNFVVQFHLETEPFQEVILNKRLEIGRQIYNALLRVTHNRYEEMLHTKLYRNLTAEYQKEGSDKKALNKQLFDLRKAYGLEEYSFHSDVKAMQKHFKKNIDSFTAQKIASRLWRAHEKLIFGNGETIHYKKYGEFNSLEGKSNGTGIRLVNGSLLWNGLTIPVAVDYQNPYEAAAVGNDIAYCRIVRKYVRNKYKYYVQVVFKGDTPQKPGKTTGLVKHPLGCGDVGLDIGTQTVAVSSADDVKIYELADRCQNIENEKRRLQRRMDRSRRATNPDNFNPDGTVKKQGSKKVKWYRSKRYIKARSRLKEICRKKADIRKLQHEILANYILSLGCKVYVETMNFKGLQKRARETDKNGNGRFKRKKRFGKSIANRAPAMFLNILDRKLRRRGTQLNRVNTWSVKASQYNHTTDSNTKKKLSQRWNIINGDKVQRDMYSAFLIMNANRDLNSINKDKCNERYANFLHLHNKEVSRLSGQKNLSSIAI